MALDFGVGGEAKRIHSRQFLRFDFVQGMVAAQEQQHECVRVHHRDGLDRLCERRAEQGRYVLAAGHARGRDLVHGCGGSRARRLRRQRLGHFDVRSVVRIRAVGDGILAGVGEHVKLVRARAADGARVGGHSAEFKPQARKDARVGVEHVLVFALQVGVIGVKGVAVFHGEFAPAHDAETRPALVAELRLDLVEMHGQLAVAPELVAREIGDDLFGRRLNHEVALVPVLETQQLRPVLFPAARFLPQFRRLH